MGWSKNNNITNKSVCYINGKTYYGNNVQVRGDKVYIDGKLAEPGEDNTKEINIKIEGNIESLTVDNANNLEVQGNIGSLESRNANVICGDVNGSVSTRNGNIHCGNIKGDATVRNGNINRRI